MERRSVPEYETLKKFLPDICKYLSGAPAIITPLARDLNAARIVDFQVANAAAVTSTLPFERASALITAAMGTIESDPGKFETLLEKLSNHDLKKIVEKMEKHCDKLGRSKKDTGKEDSRREPLDQGTESSQKGGTTLPIVVDNNAKVGAMAGACVAIGTLIGTAVFPGLGTAAGTFFGSTLGGLLVGAAVDTIKNNNKDATSSNK